MQNIIRFLLFSVGALTVWALAGLVMVTASSIGQGAELAPKAEQVQLMPSPDPICGQHREMLDYIEKKFGETVAVVGLTRAGGLLEVLVNPDTRAWTVIVVTAQGRACVKAVGQHWKNLEVYRPSQPNADPIQRIIPRREQPV